MAVLPASPACGPAAASNKGPERCGAGDRLLGEPGVSRPIKAAVRRVPSASRDSACASSGRCSRPAARGEITERVAKEQPGRLASWRSRLPLVPRHTPAAASRTSPVRSSGGEAPFGESLCPGACVGLYDAHKSRGQQCRVSSCAGYGCCLGAEETLDVDRWRLRLSSRSATGSTARSAAARREIALSRRGLVWVGS